MKGALSAPSFSSLGSACLACPGPHASPVNATFACTKIRKHCHFDGPQRISPAICMSRFVDAVCQLIFPTFPGSNQPCLVKHSPDGKHQPQPGSSFCPRHERGHDQDRPKSPCLVVHFRTAY